MYDYQEGGSLVAEWDPAVRKETGYIALWVGILSLVMEAVFLLIRRWDWSVLAGNLGGAAVAIGNFLLLAVTVSKAIASGEPEAAARRVKGTATLRLLGVALACVLLVAVAKTNVYATLIPLLFPRIGLAFRPLMDKKRGADSSGAEGSDLID